MTLALIAVAILMSIGFVLRLTVPVFRWLYIPASVIAGGLGLAIVQAVRYGAEFRGLSLPPAVPEIAAELGRWPGWLIAVVFAALLLEKREGDVRGGVRRATSQVVMVWIIVLGQTAIGLLITWIIVQPFYDVPNSFGMLIETGFAGGHGTAAAMGVVFQHPDIGLRSGLDLGILMATAGLIYGVVSGIFWINIAVRLGWIRIGESKMVTDSAVAIGSATSDSTPRNRTEISNPTPIGFQVIDRDVIDPLLLQMVWLALAFGIGAGIGAAVDQLAQWIDAWRANGTEMIDSAQAEFSSRLRVTTIVSNFPLFIYTLLGGWIVRRTLIALSAERMIDNGTILRLSAVAMDILVVAAITSLNLQAVASLLVPFTAMLVGGMLWTGVCLMVLSRWILPKQHWFQLGLINYGMSTGTTATGFVLLRVVDPELRSHAAEDYALAAPFSAPFIGGGMITVGLPLLLLERVPIWASALSLAAMVIALIVVGMRLRVDERNPSDA
jgi:ESS family glutamate:Na+ symporter